MLRMQVIAGPWGLLKWALPGLLMWSKTSSLEPGNEVSLSYGLAVSLQNSLLTKANIKPTDKVEMLIESSVKNRTKKSAFGSEKQQINNWHSSSLWFPHAPFFPHSNFHTTIKQQLFFFKIYLLFIYLFIYFWLHQVLVEARRIFVEAGGIFCCGARASL